MAKQEDRMERVRNADAHGDQRAGDEGVDDPAMSRTHRDDMSATRMQGDKLGIGTTSMEDMQASGQGDKQTEKSQRSERTNTRANDELYDDATNFTGEGAQKGAGADRAEGTGYTKDDSNTEHSSGENPLS